MARIRLDWKRCQITKGLKNWRELKSHLAEKNESFLSDVQDPRTVYVIRSKRDFSFSYPNGHSPLLYVGSGHFQKRITCHLKWMNQLFENLKTLQLEICYALPRANNVKDAYKETEADILWEFLHRYGDYPIMNIKVEYSRLYHEYNNAISSIIGPGKGGTYKWVIRPLFDQMDLYG
ncbi:MAG: hypothetical protein L3J04_04025 [Robiginitomaculum sp.]|nr:hypothetical protein [Robiginitomaculum sp.]